MPSFRAAAAVALAALFSTAIATGAMAETKWQKDHPRRTEVNHRLNNQNRRIHHEVKDSQLSRTQAVALHRDDHQVRHEERDMASQDGGHITRQEQRTLNQQENGISHDIGSD